MSDNCGASLHELIEKGETDKVIEALSKEDSNVNSLDQNGMTLLDVACFKGNPRLVNFLLEHGADPNDNNHKEGYRALMFAAICASPDSPDICRALLSAGAKTYATNSINKTAAEMAAFVGQHECASIINNHISVEDIEKIVHPRGKESDEIFPPEFCRLVYEITRTHQIHPVKIIFNIHDSAIVMKYRKKFLYVIDRLFEKQLRSKESNEVMSLKLWIILSVLRESLKFVDEHADSGRSADQLFYVYAKFLLKMSSDDLVRPNLETLLRNAIHSFPYHQSLLFESLVKAIAQTKFGQLPDAYSYLMQGLFGIRLAAEPLCATCGAVSAKKRCSKCKVF
ncbi:hypothetical protein AB6A40_005561 [Gnathostoma spinigerum]|uniref:Uncharacterized protein n=1 Tax=Gnathostoma spinigerum TaxID=75299 RepID=A0ABD6EI00_9BILA